MLLWMTSFKVIKVYPYRLGFWHSYLFFQSFHKLEGTATNPGAYPIHLKSLPEVILCLWSMQIHVQSVEAPAKFT